MYSIEQFNIWPLHNEAIDLNSEKTSIIELQQSTYRIDFQ